MQTKDIKFEILQTILMKESWKPLDKNVWNLEERFGLEILNWETIACGL